MATLSDTIRFTTTRGLFFWYYITKSAVIRRAIVAEIERRASS